MLKTRMLILLCLVLTGFGFQTYAQQDTLNRVDKNGKKHGYWMKYNGDTLAYEGRFENGNPTGVFVYYYPNKKVKSTVSYADKGKTARTVMFHMNGAIMAIGKYTDQKKDSLWKYYNEFELLVSSEQYFNGAANGDWQKYSLEGKVIEKTVYKNGMRDGDWIQYFDNGKIKLKGSYKADQLDGSFLMYYSNGMFCVAGKYEKSIPVGVWLYYNFKGEIERKDTYKDGKRIRTEQLMPVVEPDTPDAMKEVNSYRRQLRNLGLE
jgi:antitoxin component YwqK of YwqJK toxin-antitoxin module